MNANGVSFAGRLEDVSFCDLVQFVHAAGRSGTVWVRDEARNGTVTFHHGRIIGATGPTSRPLGALLVAEGLLDENRRAEAVARQTRTRPPRSFGSVVLELGFVTTHALFGAVRRQIEESLWELVAWNQGSFEVAFDRVDPVDCLSLPPRRLASELQINAQAVLLEGLRRLDEGNRR
jgi:hypothetical protein